MVVLKEVVGLGAAPHLDTPGTTELHTVSPQSGIKQAAVIEDTPRITEKIEDESTEVINDAST